LEKNIKISDTPKYLLVSLLRKTSTRFLCYQKIGIIWLCLTITVSGSTQESMIPELSYPFLEKLVLLAKQNYPRVKALRAKNTIAELNVKRAKMSWYDFIAVSAFYSPNTSVQLTNTTLTGVQIGIFVSVGNLLTRGPAVKQAREELAVSKYTADEFDLTIEKDVKERYFRYMQQLTILKLQSQSTLDQESILKQMKYRFERGEENYETYSRALISTTEFRMRLIDVEAYILQAKAGLEELIGKKLEDVR
jgi:outer membrane protein TolC